MRLEFEKMNGAGNDFVLLDNRQRTIQLTPEQVAGICDRHRGVGADGLILLVPCESRRADWAWEFFNSDGSKAEMCGNGARCFARFISKRTGATGQTTFETMAGVISATFEGDQVRVGLTAPRGLKLKQNLTLPGGPEVVHAIDTGVPHAVLFVPDADRAMVSELGRQIRFHPQFAPRGTNVNFVQVLGPGQIRVRTYERGVEAETLACGTGITASALIAALLHGFSSPVRVRVQGGDLLAVGFRNDRGEFSDVTLTGPAEFVFQGTIEI